MAQPFTLPPLPFAEGALAPVISAQTIGFLASPGAAALHGQHLTLD